VTRVERRKRNLVWRKAAPMFAPEYLTLRLSRFVPKDLPDAKRGDPDEANRWGVWDRKASKFLCRDELISTKDDALWNEKFGLN
jgi:hypothetical protein